MIDPVLRRYWPPKGQILLLRVALADAEDARRAWAEWSESNSLDNCSWEEVRLLASAARRMRVFASQPSLTRRLDGIRRFVWTNTQICVNAGFPLLAAMRRSNIRLMLIKGAARLALDRESAADRFLRDIDVLVHPHDWPYALELAKELGWRGPMWPSMTPDFFPYHHSLDLQHKDGGAVDLHHLALFICRNVNDDDDVWLRARPASLRGVSFLAPSPADEVLLSVAHGLLYTGGPSPIADWMLDIAPLIRSGQMDWNVLEAETCRRNLETNIASGLLLAAEQLQLPVPATMLDRLISRVCEPFITDFASFATCYYPKDPQIIEQVRKAAALRAVSAAHRLNAPAKKSAGAHTPRALRVVRRLGAGLRQLSATIWRTGPKSASRTAATSTPLAPPTTQPELVIDGESITFETPPNLDAEAILNLHITLDVDIEHISEADPPYLEIKAPGLILKRWRAAAAGWNNIVLQMPAALLTMRRIPHVELRANGSASAVQFRNLTISWEVGPGSAPSSRRCIRH
jgi:hypothetical protein